MHREEAVFKLDFRFVNSIAAILGFAGGRGSSRGSGGFRGGRGGGKPGGRGNHLLFFSENILRFGLSTQSN